MALQRGQKEKEGRPIIFITGYKDIRSWRCYVKIMELPLVAERHPVAIATCRVCANLSSDSWTCCSVMLWLNSTFLSLSISFVISCVSCFRSVPLMRWRESDSSITSPGSSSISSWGFSSFFPANKNAWIIARWSCEHKSLVSCRVCPSLAALLPTSGISTAQWSKPNMGLEGRGVDSGGAIDPRRRPVVSRVAEQVVEHRSGFWLTQEATTFRRDVGGRFEESRDDLSTEMSD